MYAQALIDRLECAFLLTMKESKEESKITTTEFAESAEEHLSIEGLPEINIHVTTIISVRTVML